MIALSLAEIATITGGYLDKVADPTAVISGTVEFDSRAVQPGGLFVALPGARVDGHDYADKAYEAGALAVLAAKAVGGPAIIVPPAQPLSPEQANADIYAHDSDGAAAAVIAALGRLARAVTSRLAQRESGLRIVGVTGSAGKTSTKDLIASLLRADGPTVAPPGSFNNELGLPYTALKVTDSTRYLVAEMSARGIGHIRQLTTVTAPCVGVVLNIGTAHLGEFGSRDNIAQAKGELVEALPAAADGGIAILNADDAAVRAMHRRTSAAVVYYSAAQPPDPQAQYWASDISLDDVARPSFKIHTPAGVFPVSLQVFGRHQVSNALAAVATAMELGMSAPAVMTALGAHRTASAHRMDVSTRSDGVTIIDDSYNANPESMRAAIAALAYTSAARRDARAIAVLGEMGELGADGAAEHAAIAQELDKYHIDHLIVVGSSPHCQVLAQQASARGITTRMVPTAAAAAHEVEAIIATAPPGVERWSQRRDKDVVLLKASHAEALWEVAAALNPTSAAPSSAPVVN